MPQQLSFEGPTTPDRIRSLAKALGPKVLDKDIAKEALKRKFWPQEEVEAASLKHFTRKVRDAFNERDDRGLPHLIPSAEKKEASADGNQWVLFDWADYEDYDLAVQERVSQGIGCFEEARRIQQVQLKRFRKARAIPLLIEPTEDTIHLTRESVNVDALEEEPLPV